MLHERRLTVDKIDFYLRTFAPLVYRRRVAIPPFRFTTLPDPMTPPPVDDPGDDWDVLEPPVYWAPPRLNFALRSSFAVPSDFDTDAPVALLFGLGEAGRFSHPEALIYIDGQPLAACDRHHQEVLLPDSYRDGANHALFLHGWSGNQFRDGDDARILMRATEVVQIDQPTRDFMVTAQVALGIARDLDENDPARGHLLNALNVAFNLLDTREPFGDAFYNSIAQADRTLRDGIDMAGEALPDRRLHQPVLVDPAGNVVGAHAGEGVYEVMQPAIESLVAEFDDAIDRTPIAVALERDGMPRTVLSFPGKVLAFPTDMTDPNTGERLKVPHMGWNRVTPSGETLGPVPTISRVRPSFRATAIASSTLLYGTSAATVRRASPRSPPGVKYSLATGGGMTSAVRFQ